MKKIFIVTLSLFILSIFFSFGAQGTFAFDCSNRPSSCPANTFPHCAGLGPRHTACPPSNSGGTNPCTFSDAGNDYCAYFIDSSVKFSCNATHQCVVNPNGTLDSSCSGDPSCASSGGGPVGSPCAFNSDCASNICRQDASGNHTCQAPVGVTTYGGAFGGGTTSFSCGSGANAVWTLSCIFPLIANFIYWLLILAGSVALFIIIYAGIRLITSGGDVKTVETGKKTLTFAIAGLVLIFLSFFILNFIGDTTGLACIKPAHILSFTACGGGGAGGGF